MKKYLLISIALISLLGCRTAKKEWVKENFSEKTEINSLKESVSKEIKNQESVLKKTIDAKYNEILTQVSLVSKETENESTNVTGTITAEDGKEKSITVGGTTIKSNGANVSFETSNSKTVSKEFQSKFEEMTILLESEKTKTERLQSELNSLKNENTFIISEIEKLKETYSKEVKKTGFQFGIWIIVAIVIIVIILLWYFKNQIPFLSKLTT